jgi:hypothetical protein
MRWPLGKTLSMRLLWTALGTLVLLAVPCRALAQGVSRPMVSDSKVGYIDSAIPGNIFRLRYDSAYNDTRPSRAEFFYAQTAPGGPGLPLPEPRVDYQELSAYLEGAFDARFSVFLEAPSRFLNPEVNANTGGIGDLNAGFKYAFYQGETGLATLQLRTYAPTGDAGRGLGTRHTSLEPALLFYQALGERAGLEGELRYWVPMGGTDFAGDVIRYGIGVNYEVFNNGRFRMFPVAELVGWTVLSGKESVVQPSGPVGVEGAAGDTIVNAKVGLRLGILDRADLYAGYGHSLTGDRWYENIFRLELRWLF